MCPADARHSGAWAWTDQHRQAFAQNLHDPDAFIAINSSLNDQMSDSPDRWKPPLTTACCCYATAWARIKHKWDLIVTALELSALQQMASTC